MAGGSIQRRRATRNLTLLVVGPAALTGLGAALEVFDPSVQIGLAIVCGLSLLAGLIAWAGQRTSPEPPGPAPSPE